MDLEFADDAFRKISLSDGYGKTTLRTSGKFSTRKIDLSALTLGIYLLRLEEGNEIVLRKLLIEWSRIFRWSFVIRGKSEKTPEKRYKSAFASVSSRNGFPYCEFSLNNNSL